MQTLSESDLYLIGEGSHRRSYEKLGAHTDVRDGTEGVRFAVWAPNADEVHVVGDFNDWRLNAEALEPNGSSGIWSGFVPSIGPGAIYKYTIRPRGSGNWMLKADPYAFQSELRPNTASVVADLDAYKWQDGKWITARPRKNWPASPISIYEVHLSSWKRAPGGPSRFLTYRELAEQLPEYVRDMGYTHIELLPIAEYPLDRSWGYQVTGYFAPTARYGTPSDFMHFVDRCHEAGLSVLVDWVAAHFPKDAHALAQFDGTHLYEHADPRQGEHPDWGTLIFNYNRNEVRTFLLSNALFWLDRYHIDGLRVDAVASMLYLDYSRQEGQWVPNEYGGRENLGAISMLRQVNSVVHEEFPGTITIAEESTAWPKVTELAQSGGLGFDFKWNMGWMHDTLHYLSLDPIYRRHHHDELTFSLVYAFSEHFLLPLSHDEVVHGKGSIIGRMPGDRWQKFANVRLLYAYMFGHPGKKLLFMGDDFAQDREWNFDQSLDWHQLEQDGQEGDLHRGVHQLVRDLNALYRSAEPLYEVDFEWQGFDWIDFADRENSVIVFMRRSRDGKRILIFACNFTPVVRHDYRVGLPARGQYREILNTDASQYGGSGVLNGDVIKSEAVECQGRSVSTTITLPPLAVTILQLTRRTR